MAPVQILLVEDSPTDVELTREMLAETSIDHVLHVVRDGEAALDFVFRRGERADPPRPDLVLLDLNLPRRNGHEVLRAIKADEGLRPIPVVILTTSRADEDVMAAYRGYANCFITKPFDLDGFLEVVRAIEGFWLRTARLPPSDRG